MVLQYYYCYYQAIYFQAIPRKILTIETHNGTGLSMLSMKNKWMAIRKSNDSFLVIVFYINNGKVQVYVNSIIMHFLSINRLNWINTN